MREAFISILAVLAALALGARGTDVGKDGFNFYKVKSNLSKKNSDKQHYLRARSDEGMPEGPASGERMLYFYRTPLQLYPGLLPAVEQEYRKRTGNAFKNHMLSKELWVEDAPGKRGSKTALSLLMQGKHLYPDKENYCSYGKRGWWRLVRTPLGERPSIS